MAATYRHRVRQHERAIVPARGRRRPDQGAGDPHPHRCLGIVDASNLPAYLETPNPRTIAFYERLGFEVTGEAQANIPAGHVHAEGREVIPESDRRLPAPRTRPSLTTADADHQLFLKRGRWWPVRAVEFAGPARLAGEWPVTLLAAAVLAAEGVSFLLVGSGALWLHGESIPVGDTDVVIKPGEQNIRRLCEALAQMALSPRAVPPARDFSRLDVVSVTTSYGNLDCMLARGRLDWERLRQSSVTIPVADAGVLVAAWAHARALRRQFKE